MKIVNIIALLVISSLFLNVQGQYDHRNACYEDCRYEACVSLKNIRNEHTQRHCNFNLAPSRDCVRSNCLQLDGPECQKRYCSNMHIWAVKHLTCWKQCMKI